MTAASGIASSKASSKSTSTKARNAQDSSYYYSLLSSKKVEIEKEIERLMSEKRDLENAQATHISQRNSYESLLQKVGDLEAQVLDHNLVLEKKREGVDPEELEQYALELKENNEQQEDFVDKLFLKNQTLVKEIRLVESDIQRQQESFQKALDEADDDTIEEYEKLSRQLRELKSEKSQGQSNLESLYRRVAELEAQVGRRADHGICEKLGKEEKLLSDAEATFEQLKKDLDITQMNVGEAKSYFLGLVKQNKNELDTLKKTSNGLDRKISEKKNGLKAEVMHNEDSTFSLPLQEYTDLFHSNKKCLEELKDAEQTLSTLELEGDSKKKEVEHLDSKLEDLKSSNLQIPTQEKFTSLTDKVQFLEKEFLNSQKTTDRLVKEKEKRLIELDKIKSLEAKIQEEEQFLMSSNESMTTEMKEFGDMEKLHEEAAERKKSLTEMKTNLVQKIKDLEVNLKKIEKEKNALEEQLYREPVWETLNSLEMVLEKQDEEKHDLEASVAVQAQKTSYDELRVECLGIIEEIGRKMATQ